MVKSHLRSNSRWLTVVKWIKLDYSTADLRFRQIFGVQVHDGSPEIASRMTGCLDGNVALIPNCQLFKLVYISRTSERSGLYYGRYVWR